MPGRIYPDGMSPAAIKREQERQRAHDATAAATPIAQSKELGKSGALTAALKKYADPHAMLGDGKTPMTRAAVNEYADKLVILAPRLGLDASAIKNAALNFEEGSTQLPQVLVDATKALQTSMFGEMKADTSPEAQAVRQQVSDAFGGRSFESLTKADGIAGPCTLSCLDYMIGKADKANSTPTVGPVQDGMDAPTTTAPGATPPSPAGQTTDQAFQAKLATLNTVPALDAEIKRTEGMVASMRGQVPAKALEQFTGQIDQLKAKREAVKAGIGGFDVSSAKFSYSADGSTTDIKGKLANGTDVAIHFDARRDTFTIRGTNGEQPLTNEQLAQLQKSFAASGTSDGKAFSMLIKDHLEFARVNDSVDKNKGIPTFRPDPGEAAIKPTANGTGVTATGKFADGTPVAISYDANSDVFTIKGTNGQRELNEPELIALLGQFQNSSTPDAAGFAQLIQNHLATNA